MRRIDKRGTIDGTMFSAGDYLVRVGRHFDRDPSDPSGLTFEEWTPPDETGFIINATELRGVNFTMSPVDSQFPPIQVRHSGRLAAVIATCTTPAQPKAKRYAMDALIDDGIRNRCW